MKKIIYILFCIPLIFSTCQDNNPAPINSNNSSSTLTTHDWYFEIKVDGVAHRIEGTFDNSSPNGFYIPGNNHVFMQIANPSTIYATLTNKGDDTYISGENFTISMTSANLNLGVNNIVLRESADMYNSFIGVTSFQISSINYANGLWLNPGFILNSDPAHVGYGSNEFPITITQLPSATTYSASTGYTIGNPIIGSGSATIYTLDSDSPGSGKDMTRPYLIEISFKIYSLYP